NKKRYQDGWRSVQLHIAEPPEAQNFKLTNWYVERACLLRPRWRAVLARAENDDYATGAFYPDKPIRCLNGKAEGRPQRFALEFFIMFRGKDDKGKTAKFKVTCAHVNKKRRHTAKVSASVSGDAE